MLIIADAAALDRALKSSLDPKILALLTLRRDQLLSDTGGEYDIGELVQFVVVEPNDKMTEIEARIGFPLFSKPAFDWVQGDGAWLEGIVILSDDGFGIVVFVPDNDGIDPKMLSVMRAQAIHST